MILLGIVGLLALRAAADVTLAWDANTEADVVGYRLHFGTTSGSYTQQLDVGNATTGTVGGLDAGRIYFFAATAVNAAGAESGFSNEIEYQAPQPNRAPTLAPLADRTGPEGSELRFVAQAEDADLPAQTLQFTLGTGAPGGAAIDSATGEFRWTPTEAQGPGTFPLTIVVTDNGSPRLSASQTFIATVTEVNAAPALAAVANRTVAEGSELSFALSASDADLPAQTLSYAVESGGPVGAVLDSDSGVFWWTPTEAQGPSTHVVTFSVTDSAGAKASRSAQIVVNEVNAAPTLAWIYGRTVAEGTPLTFTALATDSDLPAQKLTFGMESDSPAGAVIDSSTGVFWWTPSESQGPSTNAITVTVTDSLGATASRRATLVVTEVNAVPVLAAIANRTVKEKALLSLTLSATDADVPAQKLTYGLEAGAPVGAVLDAATGVFNWTPTEAQGPSTNVLTFSVTDSVGAKATRSATIVVTEVNVAPTLAWIYGGTVAEGSLLTFTASATDADLPAQKLTFSLKSGSPTGAVIDPSTGVFRWTPTEVQGPSTNSITVTVTDSYGLSASRTTTIRVTEVNSPPVLASIGVWTVVEGTELNRSLNGSDADVPAQKLTYAIVSGAPSGAVLDGATGVFRWTPTEAQGPSTNWVTFSVSDSAGAKAVQTATIMVTEVNSAPTLVGVTGQSVTLAWDASSELDVTGYRLYWGTNSAQYTSHLDVGNVTTATVAELSPGTGYYFAATAVNEAGAESDFSTEVFHEMPNGASSGALLSVTEGSELRWTALAEDADAPAQTIRFALGAGAPSGASIDSGTGEFRWTPSEAQGPAAYDIVVVATDDGSPNLSATLTVRVGVIEINRAPSLQPLANQSVAAGTRLSFVAFATDPDQPANVLTWSLDAGAPAGAQIDPLTGAFSWTTPAVSSVTAHDLTIRVVDDGVPVLSQTARVRVTVSPAPQLLAGTIELATAPTVLRFDSIRLLSNGDQVQLRWSSEPGATYRLEARDLSGDAGWEIVGDYEAAAAAVEAVVANEFDTRCFRVQRLD